MKTTGHQTGHRRTATQRRWVMILSDQPSFFQMQEMKDHIHERKKFSSNRQHHSIIQRFLT